MNNDNHIKTDLKNLLLSEFSTFNKVILKCHAFRNSIQNTTPQLGVELSKLLDEFVADKTFTTIENVINMTDDNWFKAFREHFPNLPDDDYKIMTFLYIGYDIKTISILLNKSYRSVSCAKYNMKNRMIKYNPLYAQTIITALKERSS